MDETTLQTYAQFRPTCFDPRGLGLADRQGWLVAPAGYTRDDPDYSLRRVNYDVLEQILAKVDPEGEDHESHTFGHWGPGWFRILLVRPGSQCAAEAQATADALAGYPVLDDTLLSEREYEAASEEWVRMTQYERAMCLHQAGIPRGTPVEMQSDCIPEHVTYEVHSDGIYFVSY